MGGGRAVDGVDGMWTGGGLAVDGRWAGGGWDVDGRWTGGGHAVDGWWTRGGREVDRRQQACRPRPTHQAKPGNQRQGFHKGTPSANERHRASVNDGERLTGRSRWDSFVLVHAVQGHGGRRLRARCPRRLVRACGKGVGWDLYKHRLVQLKWLWTPSVVKNGKMRDAPCTSVIPILL